MQFIEVVYGQIPFFFGRREKEMLYNQQLPGVTVVVEFKSEGFDWIYGL